MMGVGVGSHFLMLVYSPQCAHSRVHSFASTARARRVHVHTPANILAQSHLALDEQKFLAAAMLGATVCTIPHLVMCFYGDGLADNPADYGMFQLLRFTAVSHLKAASSASGNRTGFCAMDDDSSNSEDSGVPVLDTIFETGVNCTEWLYEIPLLEVSVSYLHVCLGVLFWFRQ